MWRLSAAAAVRQQPTWVADVRPGMGGPSAPHGPNRPGIESPQIYIDDPRACDKSPVQGHRSRLMNQELQ